MFKKLKRWYKVWQGTQCWRCDSTKMKITPASSPDVYNITCEDCGMFMVRGY
jgi:hypothetical protein